MTSANSCPLWSSVYEYQQVECAFISPVRIECGMFNKSRHISNTTHVVDVRKGIRS